MDTKGTRTSVRIKRALTINVKDTCFIDTKTTAYNLKATERSLTVNEAQIEETFRSFN